MELHLMGIEEALIQNSKQNSEFLRAATTNSEETEHICLENESINGLLILKTHGLPQSAYLQFGWLFTTDPNN